MPIIPMLPANEVSTGRPFLVKRFFRDKVYATVIPRNIRLSEAPSHGKPITAYDRGCRGAEAYTQLAQEFLRKNP